LSQDIVDRPAAVEGLVVAFCVERKLSEQDAVGGDYPDVKAGDEEQDLAVAVGSADLDVTEPAQIARPDPAGLVDAARRRRQPAAQPSVRG
jgi:hypothetical protein